MEIITKWEIDSFNMTISPKNNIILPDKKHEDYNILLIESNTFDEVKPKYPIFGTLLLTGCVISKNVFFYTHKAIRDFYLNENNEAVLLPIRK